jgi:flagellar biosynthetic protein FliR
LIKLLALAEYSMLELAQQKANSLPGMDLTFLTEMLLLLLVSTLRIGAFLLSSPLFGARWLPLQVRVLMAFSLAATLAIQPQAIEFDEIASSSGVMMVLVEIAIGLTAGLTLTIWFSAMLLAGEKIASTAGLGFAAQVDPSTGGQTPVVSQILYLFMIVAFLSVDGHILAIAIMIESYEILPIGSPINPSVLLESGISAASAMFLSAAIIMFPIAIILLLVNVINGIITRSAPQLNLFSFAFPVTMLTVFILLYFSASAMGQSAMSLIDGGLTAIRDLIGGLSYG